MLSKSSTYAIRAVLFLSANSSEEKKYSPKSIADVINIPAPFLAKTLQQLTKRNIISSTKGRSGGFYLTDVNRGYPLITIVDVIDGLEKFNACSLGLPECGDENPCPVHHLIYPLRKQLIDELSNKSIANFAKEIDQGRTHLF
ncbi:RrF2 family transcriptional regulator [Aureibaculum conchae]|uniref:RrF2 family transcriptional regulator n=1 Tax=Aureibaculum sp. 2308TA14-22 TaxID=3108392 RepID=UPI003391C81F